jgi:hypothetical protein
MKKRFSLVIAIAMLLLVAAPVAAQPNSKGMTTTIVGVNRNESVFVRMENFPSNETFYILMNRNGTLGIGGYLVSKITTNSGGTFNAEFPIPEELTNEDIINIRFENVEGSYDPPYNFFYNDDTNFNPYSGKYPYGSSYWSWDDDDEVTYNNLENGFPTFTVLKVVAGSYITVETVDFPEDVRWAVYMKDGAMAADDWYEVAGFDSTAGGIQKLTLNIPSDLQYKEKIAIKFYCLDYVLGTYDFATYDIVENRDYP